MPRRTDQLLDVLKAVAGKVALKIISSQSQTVCKKPSEIFYFTQKLREPFHSTMRLIGMDEKFLQVLLQKFFEMTTILQVSKVLTQKREKSCDPYLVHCRVCIIPSY